MRCQDLTRELASPTGDLSPAEMLGHLAACPACAEWSRRSAQLDQIWEATRPLEPTPEAMDRLWARASAELEVPATLKFDGRGRPRRLAMATFVLAQAAALLVAALFLLGRRDETPVELAAAEPMFLDLNVGFDQVAVVRIPDKGDRPLVEIQDQSHLFDSPLLPAITPHDEFGAWEATTSSWGTTVASK